jgi:hypothetical protein
MSQAQRSSNSIAVALGSARPGADTLCDPLAQIGATVLQLLQPPGLVHRVNDPLDHSLILLTIHATRFGRPFVEYFLQDHVLTYQISGFRADNVLHQNRNDLPLRKPCSLHQSVLCRGWPLISFGEKLQWQIIGYQIAVEFERSRD